MTDTDTGTTTPERKIDANDLLALPHGNKARIDQLAILMMDLREELGDWKNDDHPGYKPIVNQELTISEAILERAFERGELVRQPLSVELYEHFGPTLDESVFENCFDRFRRMFETGEGLPTDESSESI